MSKIGGHVLQLNRERVTYLCHQFFVLSTFDNIRTTNYKEVRPVESIPHIRFIAEGNLVTQFSSVPIVLLCVGIFCTQMCALVLFKSSLVQRERIFFAKMVLRGTVTG